MLSLKDIPCGKTVTVTRLTSTGAIRRRLLDMGITKNAAVLVRKIAPLGDPIVVTLRGYELTLRKEDAQSIQVAVPETEHRRERAGRKSCSRLAES
jgi:ferrous iron transport protein A